MDHGPGGPWTGWTTGLLLTSLSESCSLIGSVVILFCLYNLLLLVSCFLSLKTYFGNDKLPVQMILSTHFI